MRGLLLFCIVAAACTRVGPPPDAPATNDAPVCVPSPRDVDVLWVVQSRGSVQDARGSVSQRARALLTSIRSQYGGTIRMGLTTGNASPGGVPIPPCGMTPGGDGVLLSNGAGISVVEIGPGDSLDGGLMQFDGIIGAVRNDGCVNQVLEAGLHALAPSALDLDIPAHAAFHGDRENAALFRPGDLVVVVFATLVDDCSWNETVVSGAWTPCPGGVGDWCCDAALYPASRYADAYRRAADALGVELAMVVLGAVPTADVSLAEWRAAGDPSTECEVYNPVYRSAPWRLLEVADALEPFASTQPACYDAVLSAPGIDDALRGHTCR